MSEPPSYHDLHITTETIPRTTIFDLPFGLVVTCSRTAGWALWQGNDRCLAGEYEGAERWLVLDVAGHVICDSRKP
jgi:hypothetical protein